MKKRITTAGIMLAFLFVGAFGVTASAEEPPAEYETVEPEITIETEPTIEYPVEHPYDLDLAPGEGGYIPVPDFPNF